jgi:hypothetical protein
LHHFLRKYERLSIDLHPLNAAMIQSEFMIQRECSMLLSWRMSLATLAAPKTDNLSILLELGDELITLTDDVVVPVTHISLGIRQAVVSVTYCLFLSSAR